jgi:hypothetical protein
MKLSSKKNGKNNRDPKPAADEGAGHYALGEAIPGKPGANCIESAS